MESEYTAHMAVLPSEVFETRASEPLDLEESYDYCMDVFKLHARSFHFASRYLDEPERRAFSALYGFCRLADDFADETDLPREEVEKELDVLKEIAVRLSQGEIFKHPLFRAFGDTMVKYKIPVKYLHDLVEGVRMDLSIRDVKNEEELYDYCYHVASTVGIMMCYVWNRTDQETLDRAADLGIALQLTNILRDVDEDFENGRIYIPQEVREKFRVTRSDFENKTATPNFRRMIKSEIARANQIYARAEVGVDDLPPAGAFTVRVASGVYAGIMDEIEKMDYDVFKKRAVVPKWKKLWIAYKCRREYLKETKEQDLLSTQ
jgi:phytoene synthase